MLTARVYIETNQILGRTTALFEWISEKGQLQNSKTPEADIQ